MTLVWVGVDHIVCLIEQADAIEKQQLVKAEKPANIEDVENELRRRKKDEQKR